MFGVILHCTYLWWDVCRGGLLGPPHCDVGLVELAPMGKGQLGDRVVMREIVVGCDIVS